MIWQVDYALREVVLEQSEKLDAVRTLEQVWTYLLGKYGVRVKLGNLQCDVLICRVPQIKHAESVTKSISNRS